MKVLKDNYSKTKTIATPIVKPYPRKHICEDCSSSLEYEKSDIRIGALGCVYLDCPLCGCNNILDDNEETIKLTMNNIEFPTHFWHASVEKGAVDCLDEKHIRKYIGDAINYFRKNKDEYVYQTATGNLTMHIYRCEDEEEYEVVVAGNYYSAIIPFEPKDYR